MAPRLHLFLVLLFGMTVLSGCAGAAPSDPVDVVASIVPLGDWARQVGAERVRVEVIVPAGVDPRTYQPTGEQTQAIQRADVVLFNGLGLEPWISPILEEADNARIVVLDISQYTGPLTERIPLRGARSPDEPGEDGRHRRPGEVRMVQAPIYSRYLWLDIGSAMAQLSLIAQTLTRADPNGIATFQQNAVRHSADLQNLDWSLHKQIDAWKWRSLVSPDRSLHPFSRRYRMPLYLLGELARQPKIPASQPVLIDQFANEREYRQARAAGRPLAVLNPLAGETYAEIMRTNVYSMTLVMTDS